MVAMRRVWLVIWFVPSTYSTKERVISVCKNKKIAEKVRMSYKRSNDFPGYGKMVLKKMDVLDE